MRLFLIRHGELPGDQFVCLPRPASGCLCAKGIAQAVEIRKYLGAVRMYAVFSRFVSRRRAGVSKCCSINF